MKVDRTTLLHLVSSQNIHVQLEPNEETFIYRQF